MAQVIIFHGLGGSPRSAWIPELKSRLKAEGYEVVVPRFPASKRFYLRARFKDYFPGIKTPTFDDWYRYFQSLGVRVDENTILVGHSLGGAFILKLLERLDRPVKAAVLVAAPAGATKGHLYIAARDFTGGFSYDWAKIRSRAARFVVFQSDNDQTVALPNGQLIATNLGVDLKTVSGGGHWTFRDVSQLLIEIKSLDI